jgi:hypothetical protein
MAALKGTKTEQNLKDAFAGESQANRRYLYFANKADVEGQKPCFAAPLRAKPAMPTGTWSFWSMALATRPPACPLAAAAKT